MDQRIFAWRDEGGRRTMHRLRNRYPPVDRIHVEHAAGSTCNDPIEVVRITPRFHQSLTAPTGATIPVRMARAMAIECCQDEFGRDRHLMNGAIGVVDQLLGMP